MAKSELLKTMCDPATAACATATSAIVGIDRREFITKSALAAAVLALAACGGTASDITGPTPLGTTINISDHAELANVGGVASFNLSGAPIAVVRTDASTFVALSRVCPHQGTTIGSNGNGFTCPNHGAMFSKTGTWVGGQPTSNLQSYAVTFDATANTLKIS